MKQGKVSDDIRPVVFQAAALHYFVSDELVYDDKAVAKFLDDQGRERVARLESELAALPHWEVSAIEKAFKDLVGRLDIGLGKLAQPARVALTGGTVSPGIFELCAVLGRERTLGRLGAVARLPS